MAVFKAERFLDHRTAEPFILELDEETGARVTFKDPNRLPVRVAFQLQTEADENPQAYLEALLGDDFEAFWAVWGDYPTDAVTNLIKAVTDHFRR